MDGKNQWERKKAGEDIRRGGSANIAGVLSLLPGGWQVARVQIRAAEACARGMPESSFRAGIHPVKSNHGHRIQSSAMGIAGKLSGMGTTIATIRESFRVAD
jgi:hypothetical protein